MDLTVLGNLTVDEIVSRNRLQVAPGGAAFYVPSAAAYLGARVHLVSNVGPDYPSKALQHLRDQGVDTRQVTRRLEPTTRFKLAYSQGIRTLWLLQKGVRLENTTKLRRSDAIHLGPVYREIGREHFELSRLRTKFLSADVQGLLRRITRLRRVHLHRSRLRHLLKMCDLVKASQEEAEALSHQTEPVESARAIQAWCGGFALVTRGAKGTLLAVPSGSVYTVPRYHEMHVVDPTGAGDTLVAGWIHTYLSTRDPLWATSVGSAFASLVVRSFGSEKFRVSRTELFKRSAQVYRNITSLRQNS